MSTLDTTAQPTLLDLAKEKAPNGDILAIAGILDKSNPIIQMMPYVEANDVTSHRVGRDSSLPSGSWAGFNEYVAKEDNKVQNATEPMGMLKSYSQVDKSFMKIEPDFEAYRMRKARKFIEGLGQTLATAYFYGDNSTDNKQFTGLAPRLGTLQTGNYRYVIGNGGTGSDLTSIYIVMPGEGSCYMVYPRGDAGLGLQRNDLGTRVDRDTNGKILTVLMDEFIFSGGLAVEDTRSVARVANIEARSVGANGFDEDNLIEVLNWMPEGRKIIMVSKEIATQMQIASKDKNNVNYNEQADRGFVLSGRMQNDFNGFPVVKCEAITATETAIT